MENTRGLHDPNGDVEIGPGLVEGGGGQALVGGTRELAVPVDAHLFGVL